MNKLVLCTTGTSIGKGCEELREAAKKGHPWEHESVPGLKQCIRDRLKDIDLSQDQEQRKCSAEMNSLNRLKLCEDDRVVLLATDTADGRATSEVLRETILKTYGMGEKQVELKHVVGLQVRDSEKLRKEGLRNFVNIVLDYLADEQIRYEYEVILNPTGGFKGVVPFLTILGMLYRRRSVYIFEHAEELIDLPPLPFAFDLNLYQRAQKALQRIEQETAVREEIFFDAIDGYCPEERDLFLSFTEPVDSSGNITLSPLAFCLLKIETEGSRPPKIRSQVRDFLKRDLGDSGKILRTMISNCSSPLWRNTHYHTWSRDKTDLIIMKRSASSERLAGFLHEGVFHVTHAFSSHDKYEKELENKFRANYNPSEFTEWASGAAGVS